MARCTFCSAEIRTTKKNVELRQHWESRHPTGTFATCFPGAFDPTAVEAAAPAEVDATAAPVAAPVAAAPVAPKKKKEDLSFLSSALESKAYAGRKK